AGKGASIADAAYEAAGATIAKSAAEALKGADVVLAVQTVDTAIIPEGVTLISQLNPLTDKATLDALAKRNVTALPMELMPRISRAQSMDVLSSQSNLAGYRAVIDAVSAFTKAIPMMMTAAGTVAPAKVLVLGAGVAGLQAIATAKRLGAVVSAFDVRPA